MSFFVVLNNTIKPVDIMKTNYVNYMKFYPKEIIFQLISD